MKILYIKGPNVFLQLMNDNEDVPEYQENKSFHCNGITYLLSNEDDVDTIPISDEEAANIQYHIQFGKFEDSFSFNIDGTITKKISAYLRELRVVRDKLLRESDTLSGVLFADIWNMLSEDLRQQWIEYREYLRDIPSKINTSEDVANLVWNPTPLPALDYIKQSKLPPPPEENVDNIPV